ncbi:MAG: multicopper oxidase domain-containing protein [Pseudolysinimonas sp.]
MSSLSGAWLVLALLQSVAWIGASLLGAGLGSVSPILRARLIAVLAVVAVLAGFAALGTALALAAVDWTWAAEKLVIAAPIGLVSSVVAAVFTLRSAVRVKREEPSVLFPGILISATLGALIGPLSILLIGSVVTWPAVLAVVLVWISGSAVALLAVARRPRRAVVASSAFAGLSVVLLALFTVFGPALESAASGADGHHLPVVPGDSSTTVSVGDLRETDAGTATQHFDLEARHQTITLPDGSDYDAVTFGSVPGPELVVTQGELVEVTLTNRDVDNGVTLHWHGYDVPSGDDGVAGVTQDAVMPGESFTGTYWYHTHQDALEGIVRGLYGALIVLPADTDDDSGAVDDRGVTALIHTISGETLVGADSVLTLPVGGLTRLRLGNTDQAPHRIVLDVDTQLIALDGIDLAEPATLRAGTSLRIPAGGRADLLVDASGPASLEVERGDGSGVAIGGATEVAEIGFRGPEFDVLDAASGALPSWANEPFDVSASQVLDRLIRVVDGLPRLADTINGAAFPNIAPIVVDEGDTVLVTIVNRGTETHPMHLHGHHMVVISRNGVPVEGALWLDTIDVRAGETWQVAFVADNPGLWMDHCHNLDHAAAGMVMHLAYRGVTSPFELGGDHGNTPE